MQVRPINRLFLALLLVTSPSFASESLSPAEVAAMLTANDLEYEMTGDQVHFYDHIKIISAEEAEELAVNPEKARGELGSDSGFLISFVGPQIEGEKGERERQRRICRVVIGYISSKVGQIETGTAGTNSFKVHLDTRGFPGELYQSSIPASSHEGQGPNVIVKIWVVRNTGAIYSDKSSCLLTMRFQKKINVPPHLPKPKRFELSSTFPMD